MFFIFMLLRGKQQNLNDRKKDNQQKANTQLLVTNYANLVERKGT
jgi:hypothetical protein